MSSRQNAWSQFFSSTFNKGERVALLTAGGDTIVSGVVEAINLLNTTVRTDLGVPVSIPNKVGHRAYQPAMNHFTRENTRSLRADGARIRTVYPICFVSRYFRLSVVMQAVAEMLVKNESRIKFSTAMTTFRSPRQVLLTFKLRLQVRAAVLTRSRSDTSAGDATMRKPCNEAALASLLGAQRRSFDNSRICALEHVTRLMFVSTAQDMGRVEDVKAGIMAFLESSADVEPSLPRASWFGGPTDYYLEVGMLVGDALSNLYPPPLALIGDRNSRCCLLQSRGCMLECSPRCPMQPRCALWWPHRRTA